MARPNQARLDLSALRHNLAHARTLAPHSRIMAVVKANAYGHGAPLIASALEPAVDALAVACIEEALELRAQGIEAPILLLEGIFDPIELQAAVEHNFWLMVDNDWHLDCLEQTKLRTPLRCWLKIDTGMHRLGIAPERAGELYHRLQASPNVDPNIVLSTHFACADDLDSAVTNQQIALFEEACQGIDAPRSAANSPGLLGWPEAHYDWIRPGYMLYGNSPFHRAHPATESLQPVMTLCSGVISVREVKVGESVGYGASWVARRPSKIATVCIGYGDGYPRLAPAGTPVLVNGHRAPLAGRVSMDMITVDVTDLPPVQLGDEVVAWGQGLPVGEIADWVGTIGYELTTRMPARTPRIIITQ